MVAEQEKILVVRTAGRLDASVADVRAIRPAAMVRGLAISRTVPCDVAARELPRTDEVVIFTSGEAVRWGPAGAGRRCICVGLATAQLAAQRGWQVTETGGGGVARMMAGLDAQPRTNWVHWQGENALIGWHRKLQEAGHTVRTVVGYTTQFVLELPGGLSERIFVKTILMSAASAAHLLKLREAAKLTAEGTAHVPSLAVAEVAAAGFAGVRIATQPTWPAVLATLQDEGQEPCGTNG